ncbi:hypothetical protein HG264_05810 [Pseudomonas sp. gcc21]|uniref:hypothetical protein n=1 Tax=Pseudomonas sp. gcc21 TaxID=2726989 RepID=UPI0014525BE3|nr:hypothetical protein [Pseudomonas sp. gcc21]QJD58458.1 hypothetical protein HG264_05810 [Pseudomonas sp. gcc21]
MKKTSILICLPAALLTASCTNDSRLPDAQVAPPPAPQTVQVYKPTGAVQCGNPGATGATLALQLVESGVSVSDASCGHDGMMRIAQCGAPDGSIAVFAIAQRDLAKAQQAGFNPLAELPSAQLMPCNVSP